MLTGLIARVDGQPVIKPVRIVVKEDAPPTPL